jgi:hypothetical protein
MLRGVVRRAGKSSAAVDNEYRIFAEKCQSLHEHVENRYGVSLNPREIDNLLLYVHEHDLNIWPS